MTSTLQFTSHHSQLYLVLSNSESHPTGKSSISVLHRESCRKQNSNEHFPALVVHILARNETKLNNLELMAIRISWRHQNPRRKRAAAGSLFLVRCLSRGTAEILLLTIVTYGAVKGQLPAVLLPQPESRGLNRKAHHANARSHFTSAAAAGRPTELICFRNLVRI